jgi:hypothetical protein
MHYLSSVYSITITLHVSGYQVAHHQEVTMYVYDNCYVLYLLVDGRRVWPEDDSSHHVGVCYNSLARKVLLKVPKYMEITGLLPTVIATGYRATARRLPTILPTVPISSPETPNFDGCQRSCQVILECDTLPLVFKCHNFLGACGLNFRSIRKKQ